MGFSLVDFAGAFLKEVSSGNSTDFLRLLDKGQATSYPTREAAESLAKHLNEKRGFKGVRVND